MKPDRVIALLTERGKRILIPKLVVGMMEELAKAPDKVYGNNRAEMIRNALCWMKTGVDRMEREKREEDAHDARIMEIRTEPGFVPPREILDVVAEMDRGALTLLDECMSRVLEIIEPEKLSGTGVVSLVMDRLGEAGERRKAASAAGKEAA